jgi:hypothetical protein
MAGRIDRIAAHVTAAPLVGVSASLAPNPVLGGKITLAEVESTIKAWAQAANERDIEKTVAMYDPEIGRLLGTVDEAASPRRTSLALIKDYFSHFLGDNSAVVPHFPAFDAKDVIFLAEDTVAYSGYYVFTLTSKDGVTKDATAKFTYILRKTPSGVKIVTHMSGLTPTGVVVRK